MTKTVEVVTSVERRRRWSRAEKERIVAAALEPGAVASEVARAAGMDPAVLERLERAIADLRAARQYVFVVLMLTFAFDGVIGSEYQRCISEGGIQ